jgi:hypothetical protein
MLSCNHDREPHGEPRCLHLASSSPSYIRWYVGRDLDAELLCKECTKAREAGDGVETRRVCRECHDRLLSDGGSALGVRGNPGIRERKGELPAEVRETVLPKVAGKVLDLASVPGSHWLILAEGMILFRFDGRTGEASRIGTVVLPPDDSEPWNGHGITPRIHASRCGELVAVVNDYGRFGQLLDAKSGRVLQSLDGGDYHQETVPFSFAFVEREGRTVAIHRTEWNRLDATDPETGKLLTERGPTRYGQDKQRPDHYLDYFHGAIYPSPDGNHLFEDGWLWHPIGLPAVFSLERWLGGNVWESEDGESRVDACARDYCWDEPMAWLDSSTVAIGGIGEDSDELVPGARVFDITATASPGPRWRSDLQWCKEIQTIPGPAGFFFGHAGMLFSSDESGLSRWDPKDGARTGFLPGFSPSHHHPETGELACVHDGRLLSWKLPG